jgi:hypothetical protein
MGQIPEEPQVKRGGKDWRKSGTYCEPYRPKLWVCAECKILKLLVSAWLPATCPKCGVRNA